MDNSTISINEVTYRPYSSTMPSVRNDNNKIIKSEISYDGTQEKLCKIKIFIIKNLNDSLIRSNS